MAVSTLQVANPSMGTVTRAPQTTAATPAPPVSLRPPLPPRSDPGPAADRPAVRHSVDPHSEAGRGYLRNIRFTISSVVNATTPDVFSWATRTLRTM